MNNLPIGSNSPQPSGNAANALQAGIATDCPSIDARLAEPFAFLLARQIDGSSLSTQDAMQSTIAIDGSTTDGSKDPALKDAQDPTAAANASADPASMMAAILLQLSQKAEGTQATQPLATPNLQKTESGQITPPITLDSPKQSESMQATQPVTLDSPQGMERKITTTDPESSQMTRFPAITPKSSEAASRAEPLPEPAQPPSSTAQTVALPAAPVAMPETAKSMPADATPAISTPLGSNGWADEFSQKIRWIATQQNQIAELHLNPPDLGPLDVVLKISDNQATALFASPHGAVRDAMENALPKLREILADNGIMLGNTTISDQSPRDRGMNEFMNQGFGTASRQMTSVAAPEPAGSSPVAAQTIPARRHNGMVDTFA